MNKSELIKAAAVKAELTKAQLEQALEAILETITTTIPNEPVKIQGFGNFEVRERAERNGVNPQTKEKIVIEATKVPAFKAANALKDAVKG